MAPSTLAPIRSGLSELPQPTFIQQESDTSVALLPFPPVSLMIPAPGKGFFCPFTVKTPHRQQRRTVADYVADYTGLCRLYRTLVDLLRRRAARPRRLASFSRAASPAGPPGPADRTGASRRRTARAPAAQAAPPGSSQRAPAARRARPHAGIEARGAGC